MVGTKEPIARADEHNRHPNIVEVRIPNLLRRPPEVGLVKHITLIIIDVVHAETTKKRTQLYNLDGRPVGDPGEGPGGVAPPRHFKTKLRPEVPKKALLESARPPSPSYLRVWIRGPHPLSQGLDPALQTAWPLESATKTSTTTAISIDENNPAHATKNSQKLCHM